MEEHQWEPVEELQGTFMEWCVLTSAQKKLMNEPTTLKDFARVYGSSTRTLSRWKNEDEAFGRELRRRQEELAEIRRERGVDPDDLDSLSDAAGSELVRTVVLKGALAGDPRLVREWNDTYGAPHIQSAQDALADHWEGRDPFDLLGEVEQLTARLRPLLEQAS